MRNVRDASSIRTLARQILPGNTAFISRVYERATREPYGYLLVDLLQETPALCRFRSSVFPLEATVYVPTPNREKQSSETWSQKPIEPM